jgi:hypothetical protein
MPAEEIIRYGLSFLGGGIISAVGNWFYSSWSTRRAREVDLLQEQNRRLFVPDAQENTFGAHVRLNPPYGSPIRAQSCHPLACDFPRGDILWKGDQMTPSIYSKRRTII